MAKKRPFSSSGVMSDIELQFNRDLKAFIQLAYDGLSSSQGSPVYTGYFASSWKVGLNAIKRESYEEKTFMMMWHSHLISFPVYADMYVPMITERFARKHGPSQAWCCVIWLWLQQLVSEFV